MSSPGEENTELIFVARTVRTRGLKGELVADLLTDFPERFERISQLQGIGPSGKPTQLNLESYWFQNGRVVLKFSGYDTIESAQTLVGYDLGLPEEERVELAAGEFYDWELEGCSVAIENGPMVGKVREVMRTGGVELLVVEDEARREHLIPMAESIVVRIDLSSRKILIDPPEGLLDL
ncbi:MAG TPA: ribosome maturation factor RimM [Pyrinomonadaceae bacterium]|nr:ribosome maturation factor RimM [Pyrinomonadaceae bacterium]